jgi:hypothetical protein
MVVPIATPFSPHHVGESSGKQVMPATVLALSERGLPSHLSTVPAEGTRSPLGQPQPYFTQPGNGHTNGAAADSNGQTVT